MNNIKANNLQSHSFFACTTLINQDQPLQHLQSEPYEENLNPSMSETHRQLAEDMQQNNRSIPDDQNQQPRFYDQYKKIYTVAHHISLEKSRLQNVLKIYALRLKTIEDKMKNINEFHQAPKLTPSEQTKIKRLRRTDQQISKMYQCTLPYCDRYYSSEGSLHQHIKIKHIGPSSHEFLNISSNGSE